jgi:hypothetical protein
MWIRVQGKAQTDSKAEHTRKYVSILNRFDEHLNIHTNRCEIPPILAGQRRHGHLDAFLRWVLNVSPAIKVQHQVLFRTERSITQQIKAKQATIPSIAVIPSILTSHLFWLINSHTRFEFLRARSYHSNDRNSVSINLDRHQW